MCYTELWIIEIEGSSQRTYSTAIVCEHDGLAGLRFNHDEVFRQLRKTFGNVTVGKDDLLLKDAERVRAIAESKGMAGNPLIRSLYQKAKDLGPAIPFEFLTEHDDAVRGSVRRYDIHFRYKKNCSPDTRKRIKNFLESFNLGTVEERPCE